MNETLKATLDMMRGIARGADIKVHRGFTDFLADRIVQATTKPTLLDMIERFAALLNAQVEFIEDNTTAKFIKAASAKDSSLILGWLCDYSVVAAMVIMQKNDELYESCIKDIEINEEIIDRGVAVPNGNFDIPITLNCLSPLAHGADTKAGNATLFRRMQILSTTGKTITLPFYAGNAFRGQIRDLLAHHFLASLGLVPRKDDPPCSLWFFHALYAGGALEENSEQAKAFAKKMGDNGSIRANGVHELRNMIPPISLLGAALGNRIVSGRVCFNDFRPCCQEWANGSAPVGTLFEWTFLTRREDYESHGQGQNSSMIANTECLKAGTVLLGGIDVSEHATDEEKSCLSVGLELLKKHGYIGAESRRGLGKVQVNYNKIFDPQIYENYLAQNKNTILEYLKSVGALNKEDEGVVIMESPKKNKKVKELTPETPEPPTPNTSKEEWEPPKPENEKMF